MTSAWEPTTITRNLPKIYKKKKKSLLKKKNNNKTKQNENNYFLNLK